ncbi:MAG: diguanylate cyclase, partial [Eubacteriales bacterium]
TKISTIIEKEYHDPSMVIQLISKQGSILYHPNKDLIMKIAKQNEIVQHLLKGNSGFRETTINDKSFLTGYSFVPELGWGVLVEYPKDQALRSAVHLRNIMIMVTILICLLAFFITFLESKAITKPLEILLEGVQRVAAGDYHFNVNIKSQNEIGVLASSFNSMVERIKVMREDILQKKEELEKANIELQVMAITDGLTKLYNHRYFQDCLAKAVSFAEQENQSITLMILDIDYFKYYNDLFGHQAGDKLLEELAQLLIRELGPNDMVARYGGEEFTIILYGSDNQHGLKVAENLRTAVEAFPFPGREQQPEGRVTVSIGVASFPENAKNKEELVKLADEALYKAKCCSRNKVELYFSVLDELKQDLDQSEVELVNSIKMLIRIINAKDKYTYGHSERVGRYAVSIAEELGLPEDEVKTIKMGAFLHDIGKIEVSRGVLMKRGSLADEEFEMVKKHPFWGAGIIKAVDSLSQTLPLIKYHHEHFDGNGYPRGLKGVQIPLHARILAVADSFDAMTSNRPYRKRKSFNEAIEELERCAGTQFDPEIVKVFMCVLQEQKVKVG